MLLNSKAYLKLSPKAIMIYQRFLQKQVRRYEGIGKRKDWITTNNGEIEFTYTEAKEEYGISRPTFVKALDELIEFGFIDMTIQGGLMHTPSKFAISNRWLKFGTADFEHASRPSKRKSNKVS